MQLKDLLHTLFYKALLKIALQIILDRKKGGKTNNSTMKKESVYCYYFLLVTFAYNCFDDANIQC